MRLNGKLSRIFLVFLFVAWVMPDAAQAWESAFGLVMIEESDDRIRPGLLLHLGLKGLESQVFYYGRSFGPVQESTGILSLARSFPVPKMRDFFAATGLALLREDVRIDFGESYQEFNRDEQGYNLGLFFGLRWVNHFWKKWFLQIAWSSAVFPAGLSGGLFLATGRKQLIFSSLGYRW